MKTRIALLALLLSIPAHVYAEEFMKAPAETKTTAEIVVAAEKEDVSGGLRSDPNVSSVEYRSSDVTAFVA